MGQIGFTLSIARGDDAATVPLRGVFLKLNNGFAITNWLRCQVRFGFS